MTRVMTVFGTRPEAIKIAPVVQALGGAPNLESFTVVTGQHRAMLDQVNEAFGLVPDVDLNLFGHGQSLNSLVARALEGLDSVIEAAVPDAVLIQGDTSTAFAGALAAFNRGVPVIHLEAGLRSGELASPFPEEGNRRLISAVTRLHLAPTVGAKTALVREAIDPRTVAITGNTVIDALLSVVRDELPFADPRLAALESTSRRIVLVTVHRRENWGQPLEHVGRAIRTIALRHPEIQLVLPLHLNPLVRASVLPHLRDLPNVLATDPLPYRDFARLIARSHLILTDSGGVQEEAPALGKPVLVLRENTERPEAVAAGTAKLVGTDETRIVNDVEELLTDEASYAEMANAINPYGDGLAAKRVVAAIAHLFGMGERLPDFV